MLRSVFVSSTFRDMHYERDIIHSKVIPAINSISQQYGESVAACDLRWGIDTSAMSDEESSSKVLRVCLNEIDRTRPYMIVILGYRYGWMPGRDRIHSAIMEKGNFCLEDEDISVTALEIEYGSLLEADNIKHTLFYFREIDCACTQDYQPEDDLHKKKLEALKDIIRNTPGAHVHTYYVRPTEDMQESMDIFADMVINDLQELLAEEWKQNALLDTNELDQRKQWNYLEEKSIQMFSRNVLVQKCLTAVCDRHKDILLHGAPGTGKSTLISYIGALMQKRHYHVIPIFCGLTSLSTTGFDILKYLIWELENELDFPDHLADSAMNGSYQLKDWNHYFDALCRQFDSSSAKEIVFLIDGIDQLTQDETTENFSFIPSYTCQHIRFAVSAVTAKNMPSRLMSIEVNALSKEESREVIRKIAAGRQRELQDAVIERMLKQEDASIPLYLNLMLQRLIMMNYQDFQQIADLGDGMDAITAYQLKLVEEFPETLEELAVYLLKYASEVVGGSAAFRVSEMIAVSRHGLRFSDLHGLMDMQQTEWNELDTASFIQYMQAMFIYRNDGRYDFSHNIIRQGILKQCRNTVQLHSSISNWLYHLPVVDEVRRQEVVWHLIQSDQKAKFGDAVAYIAHKEIDASDMVKDIVSNILSDEGKWIGKVIKECFLFPFFSIFSDFMGREVFFSIPNTHRNLTIKMHIFELLHQAVQKRCMISETNGAIWDISVMDDRLADIHLRFEVKEHLEFALKCSKHSLMIRERLFNSISEYDTPEKFRKMMENESLYSGISMTDTLTDKQTEGMRDMLSIQYERGICVANADIANILIELNQDEEAMVYLLSSIHQRETMFSRNSGRYFTKNQNDLLELAESYQKAASLYLKKNTDEAWSKSHHFCYKALKLCEEAVRNAENIKTLEGFCSAKLDIAALYQYRDTEKAVSLYLECIPVLEKIDVQSRNIHSQEMLTIVYRNLSILYHQLGGEENLQKSATLMNKSKSIAEDIAVQMPSNDTIRRKLHIVLDEIENHILNHDLQFDMQTVQELGSTYQASMKLLKEIHSDISYRDVEHVIDTALELIKKAPQLNSDQRKRASIELQACGMEAKLMMISEPDDELRRLIVGFGQLSEQLAELSDAENWDTVLLALFDGFGINRGIRLSTNASRAYHFAGYALQLSRQLVKETNALKDYDYLAVSLAKYRSLAVNNQSEEARELNEELFTLSSLLYEQTKNPKYAQMKFMAQIGRKIYSGSSNQDNDFDTVLRNTGEMMFLITKIEKLEKELDKAAGLRKIFIRNKLDELRAKLDRLI